MAMGVRKEGAAGMKTRAHASQKFFCPTERAAGLTEELELN